MLYSLTQLHSQVADLQAALQVTVDQVYTITQQLDQSGSEATLKPDARLGLPAWARPNTGFTPRPESRQGGYVLPSSRGRGMRAEER